MYVSADRRRKGEWPDKDRKVRGERNAIGRCTAEAGKNLEARTRVREIAESD